MRSIALTTFLVFTLTSACPAPALALRGLGLEERQREKAEFVSELQPPTTSAAPDAGLEERKRLAAAAPLKPEDVRIWVVAPPTNSRETPGRLALQEAIQAWLSRVADPQLRKIPADHVEIVEFGRSAYHGMMARLSERTHKPTLIIAAYALGTAGTGVDVANAVRQAPLPDDQRPAVLVVSPYSPTWDIPEVHALNRAVETRHVVGHAKIKEGSKDFSPLYQAITDYLTPRLAPLGRAPAARGTGLEEPPALAASALYRSITTNWETIRTHVAQLNELGYPFIVFIEPAVLAEVAPPAVIAALDGVEHTLKRQLLLRHRSGVHLSTDYAAAQGKSDKAFGAPILHLTVPGRTYDTKGYSWTLVVPAASVSPAHLPLLILEGLRQFKRDATVAPADLPTGVTLGEVLAHLPTAGLEEQPARALEFPALATIQEHRGTIRRQAQQVVREQGALVVLVDQQLLAQQAREPQEFAPLSAVIATELGHLLNVGGLSLHVVLDHGDERDLQELESSAILHLVNAATTVSSRQWQLRLTGVGDGVPVNSVEPLVVPLTLLALTPDYLSEVREVDIANELNLRVGLEELRRTLTELFT